MHDAQGVPVPWTGTTRFEFVLPSEGATLQVSSLSYNSDSNLLAVHIVYSNGTEQIMIYTRSNWKWYCKQVIVLED